MIKKVAYATFFLFIFVLFFIHLASPPIGMELKIEHYSLHWLSRKRIIYLPVIWAG